MSENTRLLIGSLSNDLYRVATLAQRGSMKNARRFHSEAQKWIGVLEKRELKSYMKTIIQRLKKTSPDRLQQDADDYLMYSILLQNYSLHFC